MTPPEQVADTGGDVERLRAALARYDLPAGGKPAPSLAQLDAQAGYAWTAYRNGHHPRCCACCPTCSATAARSRETPRICWYGYTGSLPRCWSSSARRISPGWPPIGR
ncbi:hypothetical protein NKG94_45355 [Micromonospora sp. M12]